MKNEKSLFGRGYQKNAKRRRGVVIYHAAHIYMMGLYNSGIG